MAKVVRKEGPGKKQLQVFLEGLDTTKVGKVGFFETAKYENGTPVAYVAAINEFGAPTQNIPSRPFFRPTISQRRESWQGLAQSGAKAMIRGTATMDDVLEGIGLQAAGDIRRTITKVTLPALAASTARARIRKGQHPSKPLEATKKMLTSVTNSVEEK